MKRYLIILLLFDFIIGRGSNKYFDQNSLSKLESQKLEKKLYTDFKDSLLLKRNSEMKARLIKINNREIKFDIKFFGKKSEHGWSLFFSLHGGGGEPKSENDRLWIRHKTLYELENGILFTPRSPTNTWNMWHQSHVDTFFNRIIQNMIAFHDVDPNKIYLMGRSAGGDGVYQLAPRMADRFAAAAMSAGHPNEASPLGLRNLPFTIHVGEHDNLYNRNKVAIDWGDQLKVLQKNDPKGYVHFVKIYKGKPHWMDNLEASALIWMSDFIRNPYPGKIIWRQDDVLHKRFYWLKNINPSVGDLIELEISGQVINIISSTVSNIIIQLNDKLIDMDKKVVVKYSGKNLYNGYVSRNENIIKDSILEYGDPQSIYYGQIFISLFD
ncbi:alpha/beta hydrolase [Candidatus Marinimicrobia bacterium]|nr:alpha/beta hydrolase [Candidatus Neomarinimicrobiota bacterium]